PPSVIDHRSKSGNPIISPDSATSPQEVVSKQPSEKLGAPHLHTPGWTITKTGPGKALIVHHEDHADTETGQTGPIETGQAGGGVGCGCPDYRSAEDLDLDFQDDAANVFPTGLYPEEWSENLKDDLGQAAEAIEHQRIE